MGNEHMLPRYRRWYRCLLQCYPRPYRNRFAEGMEQTFHDLCRERIAAGKGLGGFVFWMFAETSVRILSENARFIMMQKSILRIAIVVGLILLVPLFGNITIEGWNWGPFDFVWAGALLFGTGLAYDLVARKGGTTAYRVAVGIALVTGFLLFWINAAVGIIGDEDLANVMYFGVFVVGIIGALRSRFEPRGMSHTMFVMALAQLLVPLIALTWVPEERFAPGRLPVMGLNAFFVFMWIVAGLLFRHAAAARQSVLPDQGQGIGGGHTGVAH